jgi:hypothetical protein
MSEPRRLKDKYRGGLEGALLRSAHGDAPSARARGRAFVALGVGGAVAAAPAATTAAAGVAGAKTVASVGLFAAVKWGGIGLAVGALAVGGMQEVPKVFRAHVETRTVATAAKSVVAAEGVAAQTRVENIAPAFDEEPPAALAPPAPRASPPAAKVAARAELPAESRLAEEVAVLDGSRRIVTSDPERALRLLDEYEQRFPRGDLAPEALVLRIEALVRAGARSNAESLASSYLASHPRSPHANRIRMILGWGEGAR